MLPLSEMTSAKWINILLESIIVFIGRKWRENLITGAVLNLPILTKCSFACKLEIKGSESNTEGLEEGARERDIHVKVVPSYATKLHINVIVIVFVYQLKVLDTRFIYSAIEIKYKGLDLLVPLWWFVKEEHDPLCIVNLKLLLNRLVFL